MIDQKDTGTNSVPYAGLSVPQEFSCIWPNESFPSRREFSVDIRLAWL